MVYVNQKEVESTHFGKIQLVNIFWTKFPKNGHSGWHVHWIVHVWLWSLYLTVENFIAKINRFSVCCGACKSKSVNTTHFGEIQLVKFFGQIFLKMVIVGGTALPTFSYSPSFWQLKKSVQKFNRLMLLQKFNRFSVVSWLSNWILVATILEEKIT